MNAINKIMDRAALSAAPISVLKNNAPSTYRQSSLGQTYVPAKVLKDEITGRKISLNQAKQIVAKYERKMQTV
ncbi:MAG: hypothetical protein IBX55_13020 [Methyloprofundus sp.]|nr:hypothetical protein [Methyloprofundus sp.]